MFHHPYLSSSCSFVIITFRLILICICLILIALFILLILLARIASSSSTSNKMRWTGARRESNPGPFPPTFSAKPGRRTMPGPPGKNFEAGAIPAKASLNTKPLKVKQKCLFQKTKNSCAFFPDWRKKQRYTHAYSLLGSKNAFESPRLLSRHNK